MQARDDGAAGRRRGRLRRARGSRRVGHLLDPAVAPDVDHADRPADVARRISMRAALLSSDQIVDPQLSAPRSPAARHVARGRRRRGMVVQFSVGAWAIRHSSRQRPPSRPRQFSHHRAERFGHCQLRPAGRSAGRRWRRRRTPGRPSPTSPPATAASSPNADPVGPPPSAPCPVTAARPGPPRAGTSAGPRPRRANAAGRDDSITTSAPASSARKVVGLIEIGCIGELSAVHPVEEAGGRRPGCRRAGYGLSTLTTVAPARANSCPHSGPAHIDDRSTTSSPAYPTRVRPRPEPADHTGAADGVSPSTAAGSPSRRARSATVGRPSGVRPSARSPARIGRRSSSASEQGRHRGDVVGPGQRERAPAVPSLDQPGGTAGADPALTGQPQHARPGRSAVRRRPPPPRYGRATVR